MADGYEKKPACVLVGILYAEATFNLPGIVLSVDERYRALVWLRVPSLLTAPLFLVVAIWGELFAAAKCSAAPGWSWRCWPTHSLGRSMGFAFRGRSPGRLGS